MTVVPPRSRSLVRQTDRVYDPGKAGSGFLAVVTIMPTDVSFARTEVWEGGVAAVAKGYYDKVLGWNGLPHKPTAPTIPPHPKTGFILQDKIGTNEPGSPGPFSPGTFEWDIPQLHRPAGGSGGAVYSTGHHWQIMVGNKGAEGTAKEGASRGRSP
jgi:hypothetical protein